MYPRKITTAILVTTLALVFSACGVEPSSTVDPMDIAGTAQAVAFTMIAQTQIAMSLPPNDTPEPSLTFTPVVLSDCFITFHFAAWKDFDGNGLWDISEPPLMGVKFSVSGAFAQVWGHPYLSGADGWLRMETWSPGGCPEQEVTITATSPETYEPTTPASISLSLTSVDFAYEAQFGFRTTR